MPAPIHAKVVIIGSGPAGYAAAIYAARAMLEPVLIQGIQPGGQLTITTDVEEALFVTNFASNVTIVHRRDHFRAERILQERLFKNPKIKVVWDSAVHEIRGSENPSKVTHVRLKNVKTGTLSEIPADGVFIAIGHAPATDLVIGQVKLKPSGYVEVAPNSTAASVPGAVAAGHVAA